MLRAEIYHELNDDLKIEVEDFVNNNQGSTYFQSIHFFEVSNATKKQNAYFLIVFNQMQIEALMLIIQQIQIPFPIFNYLSARNVILGGPILRDNNIETVSFLLKNYQKMVRNVVYTQVRNHENRPWLIDIFGKNLFDYIPHLNIHVDLTKDKDELWKEVHSKRRNEIRKAIKLGVTIDASNSATHLVKSYQILIEVYKRAKLPLPSLKHFELMHARGDLHCFVALYQNEVIACMFCVKFQTSLVDYYAGAYSRYYSKYPNDLLTWEVFLWGKNNGFSLFDFGGAGKPSVKYGVRDYKKKFGGVMSDFGRFEYYHSKWLFRIVSFCFKILQGIKS